MARKNFQLFNDRRHRKLSMQKQKQSCSGKVGYDTADQAWQVLKGQGLQEVREVYSCNICNKHHITSRRAIRVK